MCEVISLPVTVQLDNGKTDKGNLPVAMCAVIMVFSNTAKERV